MASSTDSAFIEDLEIEEDFPVLFPDKTSSKKPETFVVKKPDRKYNQDEHQQSQDRRFNRYERNKISCCKIRDGVT